MTTNNPKIAHYADVLCTQGCRAVYEYIELLQAGEELTECPDLDAQERVLLCHELESVMAVYKMKKGQP